MHLVERMNKNKLFQTSNYWPNVFWPRIRQQLDELTAKNPQLWLVMSDCSVQLWNESPAVASIHAVQKFFHHHFSNAASETLIVSYQLPVKPRPTMNRHAHLEYSGLDMVGLKCTPSTPNIPNLEFKKVTRMISGGWSWSSDLEWPMVSPAGPTVGLLARSAATRSCGRIGQVRAICNHHCRESGGQRKVEGTHQCKDDTLPDTRVLLNNLRLTQCHEGTLPPSSCR